jgi:tRNA pseudouridine38-40 synthase
MELHRYFIYLSYLGTGYRGWQVQPGKTTIQGTLENALSIILQEKIACTGAGRTDTGVHARFFVAHFDTVKPGLEKQDSFIFRLNRFLPAEIAANQIRRVNINSSARFDAISRTYEYTITRSKNPFLKDTALFMHGNLDVESMNLACKHLADYKDFTSFSKLHSDVKTNNCTISEANWITSGDLLIFRITADRFLRNMVRAIVGTMIEIGKGAIEPGSIRDIIEARDRSRAGKSVRGEGLSLVNIVYPDNIFI